MEESSVSNNTHQPLTMLTSGIEEEEHEAAASVGDGSGRKMEKSETTGGMSDVLSERSQIKSSESIDEQVFHEKLAYLAATTTTTDHTSTNTNIRSKIINSIKRRLSFPNKTSLEQDESGEKRHAKLTEAEKERLRQQLEFYHRHYIEHNNQIKLQQLQQQTAAQPTSEDTTEWSTMSIDQKRRLFRLSQVAKRLVQRNHNNNNNSSANCNNINRSIMNRHDSSNFSSSAYSFNSASFKQRANGQVPNNTLERTTSNGNKRRTSGNNYNHTASVNSNHHRKNS